MTAVIPSDVLQKSSVDDVDKVKLQPDVVSASTIQAVSVQPLLSLTITQKAPAHKPVAISEV